jgi:hypothetical protein
MAHADKAASRRVESLIFLKLSLSVKKTRKICINESKIVADVPSSVWNVHVCSKYKN